ncbi:hypothetical protein H9623_17855 [Oerskovia sp. Sa1BUA8]|uniref:Type II toxin-antitoxin system HicA family toxin n=2 Tax=Oerskovia TaxID=162491 RepID=A0A9D5YZV5_9CELL|nr:MULTISPECIES: hypothetical protein [Oerskovia]MBD7982739.1 hypothetical protein [Oerskovia merdavium]MBE7702158.1 hypothetical protein [Oerskovia douganii]
MDKDLRKVLQAITKAGYVVVINRKGHPEIYTRDGEKVTTFSGTPSDFRSLRNALAPLKRRGFRWPPRG